MIYSSKLVLLQNAVPGMVLSDNLLDRYGKVLLSEKTVLDEKHLESLRRHNIEMIPIVDEDLTVEERAAQMEARLARLERLFRKGAYGNPEVNANDWLRVCLRHYRQGTAE